MQLLGVVFVEEKVPSDIRYSLHRLTSAGINMWVASGDREENVMGVARNLELIKDEATVVSLQDTDSIDELDIKLNLNLMQLTNKNTRESGMIRLKTRTGKDVNVDNNKSGNRLVTITIHGKCFESILKDIRLFQCFALLISYCDTLIGYSFTPSNKYELTKMLKRYVCKNSNVLAIGDGLNDFMMLKESDLSIGILSKEILQVKNSCDMIVSRFAQIVDIMLVHGVWNYERVVYIIMFSLYANIVLATPFFAFQLYSSSGASFLEVDYLKISIESLVINITIILAFCLEQFIERPLLALNPHIYTFKFQTFWSVFNNFCKSVLKGVFESLVLTHFVLAFSDNSVNIEGQVLDGSPTASAIYIFCIILIFMKLFFNRVKTANFFFLIILVIDIGIFAGLSFSTEKSRLNSEISLSYLPLFLGGLLVIFTLVLGEHALFFIKLKMRPTLITLLREKFMSMVDGACLIRLRYFH